MILRSVWVFVFSAIILSSCTRLPDRALIHNSPEGVRQRLGDNGVVLEVTVPKDVPPNISQQYRFAHGDKVDISLFGREGSLRESLLIDPDGNVHYLMAKSVPAVGRTFEEVRVVIAKKLSDYYDRPVVQIIPRELNGHYCYVLGQVNEQGIVPINQELRILDVLAAAKGLTVSYQAGSAEQTVDLRRSFLLRQGDLLPIDFQALVQKGDLRWNIRVHPADLIYFADLSQSKVYVLGYVRSPGAIRLSNQLTVAGAIAKSGGLQESAYKGKIVVLRGNINRPQVFTVNFNDIISAQAGGMMLEPGDIVYVPERPFEYLRELSTAGIRAFIGAIGSNAAIDVAESLGIDLRIRNDAEATTIP